MSKKTKMENNLTELNLPTDYPRPVPVRLVEAELSVDLSETVSKAILRLTLSERTTPFAVLLAAFAVLLHRHTGEEDIVVGSSSASSKPLVLRMAVKSSDSLAQVIQAVMKAEEVAMSDNQLFKVRFFNLTDTSDALDSKTSSNCDLTVFISQSPSLRRILPISIRIVYNSTLFSSARVRDMLQQLQLVLLASTDCEVGQVSLVTTDSKNCIPDPLQSLNWDTFEGAITDIFAANARQFPDRVCVAESLAGSERFFSYSQIHQASNVLGHALLANGIQREDVVVLYSYRGVDLVVAIMGVLKAGATFSVIDPAYPAARQSVYLSVAKPRAIVILAKAGSLHADVRQYIDKELQVVCELPAVELQSDGLLLGGTVDGVDILQPFLHLAAVDVGVVLGPDSIGTLSFTSGSTGTPKGVRGRHYSLTHFYPWMKQEFEMTDAEHFTMLSGIAHDPIQRDIFTPLFLGARLCIPTGDDIGTPGRLAEWMAAQKITITHLTPAMGQLLSANASHHIPSLRHAFFVGDVLTKRDVLRLQHLAPNTHVINMYGTTETQRAVSFLKIPPLSVHPAYLSAQKDIMPAGRGMKDVQLLVLNSHGLLCGVGEVGELFVRSGGLAEGYLSLPEVTSQKFLSNPFNSSGPAFTDEGRSLPYYHGPRDRLYRTGDLGRYKPDGSVECTGRADDQVKIRGFRIELGEIDTHLSQHSGVRENVTLVRRDKDEEMTLVSYFVPIDARVRLSALIKDIRSHLKQKLPSYAVPTVYVPLTRMPLTPNGKVDKNALPFPDTALAAAAAADDNAQSNSDSSLTPLQRSIGEIWASLLKIDVASIALDDSFFDLGGHSILATRLIFEIRKTLAIDVPLGLVFNSPTLGKMSSDIETIRGGDLNLTGAAKAMSPSTDALSPPGSATVSPVENGNASVNHVDDIHPYATELDTIDDHAVAPKGLELFDYAKFTSAKHLTFFLTGATGFLGVFILGSLLDRFPLSKVICLVRAKSDSDALSRVVDNCKRHLMWKQVWEENKRIEALAGDLAPEKFGLSDSVWNELAKSVDVIIHNGALVHWVYPFSKLRGPNVVGTLTGLTLATTHHLKPFHFVSSTSVLDTDHFVQKLAVGDCVSESDDLEGSRHDLRTGYGQTKWVAEKLVFRARDRGVPATIIRPGYIVGHSQSGVTNTDDFLWRLVKGCIQLGKVPHISNIVNMCSVDYVADSISEIVASPKSLQLGVFHMWNKYRFRFDDLFSALVESKFAVEFTEYVEWRTALMDLTLTTADNALYPLLHFVLDDLPTSTKNPELDDSNTTAIIQNTRVVANDMRDLMQLYLGYLSAVGFIEPNDSWGFPKLSLWDGIKGQSVGRSMN